MESLKNMSLSDEEGADKDKGELVLATSVRARTEKEKKKTMSIIDLPSELIRLILYHTISTFSRGDYQDLRQATLVCRRWYPHAYSLLRYNSVLRGREQLRLWRLTLNDQMSPTRWLEISNHSRELKSVKGANVKRAIAVCSGLQKLVLERVTGLPLEALSSNVAPDLRSVRLLDQVVLKPERDSAPLAFSFRHLHLTTLFHEIPTLSALFHPGLISLDIANAIGCTHPSAFAQFIIPLLIPIAHQLEFVSIPEGEAYMQALTPFLSECSVLRHYGSDAVDRKAFELIPSEKLTTWTVHSLHSGRNIPGILAILNSGKSLKCIGSLKKLRLGAWNRTSAMRHPVRVALLKKCEAEGIEVKFKDEMENDLDVVVPWEYGRC